MKKIIALLVVILILPSLTAYASSCTSRRFVVRNWKAILPAPTSPEDVETGEQGEQEEQGEAADGVVDHTKGIRGLEAPTEYEKPPIPTTTDEVEMGEQGQEEHVDDYSEEVDQPILPAPIPADGVEKGEQIETEEQSGQEKVEPEQEQSEPSPQQ